MVFSVLRIVLLKLLTHLLFVRSFPLKLLRILGQSVVRVPQDFLVVCLLLEFQLVILVKSLQLRLLLLRDFTDQHPVVCSTTVLKQYCKHLPNVRNQSVLFFSVLQTFFYQFIEAYRINEKSSVNSIDELCRNSIRGESHSVDTIAAYWVFVFWLKYNTWDIEMLCVLQGFIDPGL